MRVNHNGEVVGADTKQQAEIYCKDSAGSWRQATLFHPSVAKLSIKGFL